MNVVGIIAEYNPFHQGHAYQLVKAKEVTKADFVVCCISGHFLQRGEPAIVNKWSRAKMALMGGADLVVELPTAYSCRSASYFALGGVSTLNNLGLVTHLAFGSENDDLVLLNQVAELLETEPPEWKNSLKKYLQEGHSFPKARSKACLESIKELADQPDFLNKPNNILAIAYLRALKKINSPITPVSIKRIGQGFHSLQLTKFSSATAIRKKIHQNILSNKILTILDDVSEFLPQSTVEILKEEIVNQRGPISLDHFTLAIFLLLRRTKHKNIADLVDINEGLENRIIDAVKKAGNIEELIQNIKTKRYTHTKISRLLTHLLIDYTKKRETDMEISTGSKYIRVLGLTKKGAELLSLTKKKAQVPIVTRLAPAKRELSEAGKLMLEFDVLATDIYSLAFANTAYRTSGQDYFNSPVPALI